MSNECVGVVDNSNPKILKIMDSKTSKIITQYDHQNDILEIQANHCLDSGQRKFLIFDQNKDLYLYFSLKGISKKISSMVTSFKWHEKYDLFVFTCGNKIHCVYSPESVLLDKELFDICSVTLSLQNQQSIEFVNESLITLFDKQGFRNTLALN